ncbi:hypothetical protein WJX73_010636 [Symbiochloris irregularis]|uniref:Uncharacterized protein n=1 Tax=Symbiochloris irregularis TaxID=706552 RepID=A0AAW1P1F7_9CHLO
MWLLFGLKQAHPPCQEPVVSRPVWNSPTVLPAELVVASYRQAQTGPCQAKLHVPGLRAASLSAGQLRTDVYTGQRAKL